MGAAAKRCIMYAPNFTLPSTKAPRFPGDYFCLSHTFKLLFDTTLHGKIFSSNPLCCFLNIMKTLMTLIFEPFDQNYFEFPEVHTM